MPDSTADIVRAVIVSIPPTLAAVAAWRKASKVHDQTKPSNGHKLFELLEDTRDNVGELKTDLRDVKGDVRGLKSDVRGLTRDVQTLQREARQHDQTPGIDGHQGG